ncbi:hypothetical protein [Kineosporia succinea]|uniref:Uncharacterized protein n=1 Tax=Kineosporia succinea TaxID=84632 RepID=A0ABT9P9S9_9ACTN|nr:hypothetical protein [Kineosporia succinea]MDP9829449.1 hypothetical protein [Kineosporia succinea]
MRYLRADGVDRIIVDAVLAKAVEADAERRNHELTVLAHNIGTHVANNLAKILA